MEYKNQFVVGRAEERLHDLPDRIVDLTVTSPPYNVDLGNNKFKLDGYDIYNDNQEHQEYINWLHTVFELVYQKTKQGGRCVINIGDGKNGSIPTHAHIINMMEHIGWYAFATIIWHKHQIGNRLAWGSWKSPSSPSFPTPFEYILVFYKGDKKLQYKGETDLEKQEFIDWTLAMWEFPGDNSTDWHPATFPEELPRRCIKMLTWKEALVIDPFAGSGTTLKVAKDLGRNYWGCDISPNYVKRGKRDLMQSILI